MLWVAVVKEFLVAQITVADDIGVVSRFYEGIDEGIYLFYELILCIHSRGYFPDNNLDAWVQTMQFFYKLLHIIEDLLSAIAIKVITTYRNHGMKPKQSRIFRKVKIKATYICLISIICSQDIPKLRL